MQKILCVCLGNTCRSPMMAALLQKELGVDFQVESGGIQEEVAGRLANEHSILCMQERGIDISQHVSRWVGDIDLTQFSHIICVDKSVADKVHQFLLGAKTKVVIANGERNGVPNPFKQGLTAYRECLCLLDEILPSLAQRIIS